MVNNDVVYEKLRDDIERLCDTLQCEYHRKGDIIFMPCPVHGGDNPTGCTLFLNENDYLGWKCWTHDCEEIYNRSIFGFVRGVLSARSNQKVSSTVAKKWIADFLGMKNIQLPEASTNHHKDYVNLYNMLYSKTTEYSYENKIISSLEVPAQYYLNRNYSRHILEKYEVGVCNDISHKMCGRVIVPVYDILHKNVIGYAGRTTFPFCEECKRHHPIDKSCPITDYEVMMGSKWLNSYGFRKTEHLYNLWNSWPEIKKTKTAIIVEGKGDIWRLEEAEIKNSVGIFGSYLHEAQLIMLEKLGVMNLFILTDNDQPGVEARDRIVKRCERYYNLYFMDLPAGDVGEMSVEQVKEIILPEVEKVYV